MGEDLAPLAARQVLHDRAGIDEVDGTVVEGQDPDVAELGPAFYKAYAEKKNVPLFLGIGAAFMALSSPQEVVERIKQYIEVGGKDGRFALLLCNLGATTPPENVKAAIDAVHRYGSYR